MSGEARILDGYIVREQDQAALQWRRSRASDDALKRRIDSQLSAGPVDEHELARQSALVANHQRKFDATPTRSKEERERLWALLSDAIRCELGR
jgi:hypothetical protein